MEILVTVGLGFIVTHPISYFYLLEVKGITKRYGDNYALDNTKKA